MKKKTILIITAVLGLVVIILIGTMLLPKNNGKFKDVNEMIEDSSTGVFNHYFVNYDTNSKLIYLSGNCRCFSPLYSYGTEDSLHIETIDEYKIEEKSNKERLVADDENTKYTIGSNLNLYITYDIIGNIVYLKNQYNIVPLYNAQGLPMKIDEFKNSKKKYNERFKVVSEKYNNSSQEYNYKDIGTAYYDILTNIVYIFNGENICAAINSQGKAMNVDEFNVNNKKERFKKTGDEYNGEVTYYDTITKVVYLTGKHYMAPLYKDSYNIEIK